jgi:hypothetical protein
MTMSDPRNLRLVVDELRHALDKHTREELVEMLGHLFKEYVIGAAPAQTGAAALLDAKSELEGMNFAQLITWLQQHLDVAELALFDVQGSRVSVRAGGRPVPIEAAAAEAPVTAPPPVAAPPVAVPAPAPAPPASLPGTTSSVVSRPAAAPAPAPAPSSPAPSSSSAPAAAPASSEKPTAPAGKKRLEVD